METLAYCELSATCLSPANASPVRASRKRASFVNPWQLKFFSQVNWKKLSSLALIRLLALSTAIGILSLASSALAALQRGDSGPQVTALQENLTAAGYYDGPITGFFGPLTEDAAIRFQQANRLLADGIVRSDTELALQRQAGRIPIQISGSRQIGRTLQRGDSGADVADLQKRLQAAGYYQGPITDFYGTLTEAAVKRFQQDRGLYPYGNADLSTQAALRGSAVASPLPNFEQIPIRRSLGRGDSGTDVADLQKRLQEVGSYDGPITGFFGTLTEAGVMRFQQYVGLRADGFADETTLLALQEGGNPPRYTPDFDKGSVPARRYSVLDLQKRLQQQGFYSGPLDGLFGTRTRDAVAKAQRRYGVSSNDIIAGRF